MEIRKAGKTSWNFRYVANFRNLHRSRFDFWCPVHYFVFYDIYYYYYYYFIYIYIYIYCFSHEKNIFIFIKKIIIIIIIKNCL